jgi:hypothetical protein
MRKVTCVGEPFNVQTIVRTLETLSERLLYNFLPLKLAYGPCGFCLSRLARSAMSSAEVISQRPKGEQSMRAKNRVQTIKANIMLYVFIFLHVWAMFVSASRR